MKNTQMLWRQHWRRPSEGTRRDLASAYEYLITLTVQRLARAAAGECAGDREDLVAPAALGLMRAIDRYDRARGVQFETYAIALIRGAIREEIRRAPWAPRSVQEDAVRIDLAAGELQQAGRSGPAELAAALGISVDDLADRRALIHRQHTVSLETPLTTRDLYPGQHEGPKNLWDMLVTDAGAVPTAAEDGARQGALYAALGRLPARWALVVLRRAGLQGPEATFAEIAGELGVSESRAYQLYHQAIARLQDAPELAGWAPDCTKMDQWADGGEQITTCSFVTNSRTSRSMRS